MNKTATKLFATLMLTAMVLSVVPLFNMAKAAPPLPPAFYIQPEFPTFFDNTTPIGSMFNETLYVSTSGTTFTYQYEVDYNSVQLNCTYAAYTAGGTSQFFTGHTTVPTGPDLSIAGKISGGETLLGADSKGPTPAGASIIIMTFMIMQGPPIGGFLTSNITANNVNSFLLDPTLAQVLNVHFGDAVYTYNWVAPAAPHLEVVPVGVPAFISGLIWNNTIFQEDIVIKGLAAGWFCGNATTQLDYNNVLTNVSSVTFGPAWTTTGWFNVDADTLQFDVSTAVPPSGDVVIAHVFFGIIDQGSVPPEAFGSHRDTILHLHDYKLGSTYNFYITTTAAVDHTELVYNYAPVTPPYLSVSSAVLGPTPSVGDEFNITVSLNNVNDFENIVGIQFRLGFDPNVIMPTAVYEGPFLGSYAALQPGSMGTFFVYYINNPDGIFGPHVIVGNMIFPNASGLWNPPMLNGSGVIATITFKLLYQSFGEPDLVTPLNIVDQLAIALDNLVTQNIIGSTLDNPINGAVTITTNWPGRMLDLYGGAVNSGWGPLVSDPGQYWQFPAPYGGQGPHAPMDLVEPQSWVYLNANVTYNYWPVQHKNVAFEIQEPDGTVYNKFSAFTDSNGVAQYGFRMPWPCENPESLFGVWHITASVQLADVIINDTMDYHYDYMVHVWKVTTDKFQYNHDDCVEITFEYGSHAQQFYPALFIVSIVDNLGVTVGIATVSTQVGGTVYCQYKNFTQQVEICLPKWAYAGIATIHINTFDIEPAQGGVAISPEYVGPTIAIQPY